MEDLDNLGKLIVKNSRRSSKHLAKYLESSYIGFFFEKF